jgi:hypothetical protein
VCGWWVFAGVVEMVAEILQEALDTHLHDALAVEAVEPPCGELAVG